VGHHVPMTLRPGDPAPDFTLQDTHGTPVHLADLHGEPVLIVFYPFAFSGICTGELCELRDNIEDFETAGVRLLAVSTDSVFTLKAWQQQEGFSFDLLSDFWPHGGRSPGPTASSTSRTVTRCAARSSSTPTASSAGAW